MIIAVAIYNLSERRKMYLAETPTLANNNKAKNKEEYKQAEYQS